MNIAAYDANELGQITDMIAINPSTNEEAKTTTTFQAMCVDANDQKFKDMEAWAKSQIAPSQLQQTEYITKDLLNLVVSMINSETEQFNQLDSQISQMANNPSIATTYLDSLLQIENKNKQDLSKYLQPLDNAGKTNKQIYDIYIVTLVLDELLAAPAQGKTPNFNVIREINEAKKSIDSKSGSARINSDLQNLKNSLSLTIVAKRELMNRINTYAQQLLACQGTDSAGNYYVCSEQKLAAPYVTDSIKKCSTGTCYKLPSANYCDGYKNNNKYSCGTTCTTPSSKDESLICPDKNAPVCCKTPTTMGKVVNDLINDFNEYLPKLKKEQKKYSDKALLPYAELELYLTGKKKEGQDELYALRDLLDEFIVRLEKTTGRDSFNREMEQIDGLTIEQTANLYGVPVSVIQYMDRLLFIWDKLVVDYQNDPSIITRYQEAQKAQDIQSVFLDASAQLRGITDEANTIVPELEKLKTTAPQTSTPPPAQGTSGTASPSAPLPPICGNGQIEPGEICDYNSQGQVISYDIVSNDATKVVGWLGGPGTDFGYYCDKVLSPGGCTYNRINGRCLDDCKTFQPRFWCWKSDGQHSLQNSAFNGPSFYYDSSGAKQMTGSIFYVGSDRTVNECLPSGMTYKYVEDLPR
jgi:hypothetical protein